MAPALKFRTPDARYTMTMPSATSAVRAPVAVPSSTKRSDASLNSAVARTLTNPPPEAAAGAPAVAGANIAALRIGRPESGKRRPWAPGDRQYC
jgi:hypothetical protein